MGNQSFTSENLRQLGLLPDENSVTKREHGPDDYPQLLSTKGDPLRIYIVGNCFRSGIVEMFAKAGCKLASDIPSADLLVFSGGEDVDPQLYGEKKLTCTYFNPDRDAREIDVFTEALKLCKPMFGICRGMQFLHVMNGGKLYQDVNKHGWTHNIVTVDTGEVIRASSMHHQMCIEDDNCFPICYADEAGHSGAYSMYGKIITDPNHMDVEGAVYPNINAIAVQGHPEVGGYPEYTIWCIKQIDEFISEKVFVLGDNIKPLTELPFMNVSANNTENT